jgi:ribosome maturation factor RimP
MTRRTIDAELEEEFAAVAEQAGCELVHAEFAGDTLRLILDRPEGVTLSHCERVSRQVSALLDTLDYGPGGYVLEVTSPGLDRQLYRPRDYQRFAGRRVRVTWREDGVKRTDSGRLESFDAAGAGCAVVAPDRGEPLRIPLTAIEMARLEIEL